MVLSRTNVGSIQSPRSRLLAGLPVSERRLRLAGVSTAVVEGGDGPPIVLLHGPGEYAAKWLRVLPDLVRSHRVIVPDLPAHGESEPFDGPPAIDRMVAWLEDLIDCTCAAPPALVGQILGGAMAARFAIERPERIRELVLVDALGLSPFHPAPEFGEALTAFASDPSEQTHDALWNRCAFDLEALQRQMGELWLQIKAYNLDRAHAPGLAPAQRALMECYGLPAIAPSELERIAVPTTLIWGRHDLATPLSVAEEASARHGWPLRVIEEAADDPPMEQPQAFVDALRGTLQRGALDGRTSARGGSRAHRAVQVRAAATKDQLQRVLDFSRRIYGENAFWVPPDNGQRLALLSGEALSGAHTRVQTFWADDRAGDMNAAVTAAVDDSFNRYWDERVGHLFFFEALPESAEAARTLLDEACDWLLGQGCSSARLSFHYGWQLPLTIDAYDEVPTFLHTYNPPYYHRYIKGAGFSTERGLVEYQIRFTPELAEAYRGMAAAAVDSGVRFRNWDAGDLRREAALFHNVYLATYAKHWGSPRFTLPEIEELVEELKDFSLAEFSQFAEIGGGTAGAVLAFPDLNRAFHAMRGKNVGEHLEEFQRHVRAIDHGILLSISVAESARGRGVALAMAARTYLAMMKAGCLSASYTIVLDDNAPSRRTAERLGGTVARNYAIYRRDIG